MFDWDEIPPELDHDPRKAEAHVPAVEEAPKLSTAWKPLCKAVREGTLKQVVKLLEAKADPNDADGTGQSPLFAAASLGEASIVALLLLWGADPGRRSAIGGLPTDVAASAAVSHLLTVFCGGNLSERQRERVLFELEGDELREAVKRRFPPVPLPEVEEEPPPLVPMPPRQPASSSSGKTSKPPMTGTLMVYSKTAREPKPVPPRRVRKNEALALVAAPLRPLSMAQAAARVAAAEEAALAEAERRAEAAAAAQAAKVAAAAKEAEACSGLSQAPLAKAARSGKVKDVLRLLKARADPNQLDELGETPLFEAVAIGSVDVVAALLFASADPTRQSLAGGIAADLAECRACRALLGLFEGSHPSTEEQALIFQGLLDSNLQDQVSAKLRAGNMQEALQHTLRKLRA